MGKCPLFFSTPGRERIAASIIAMWSGPADKIPDGWTLCDGTSGTPDLRGRFVLGAGGNYGVGAKGGEERHFLGINEMPNHCHSVPTYGSSGNTITINAKGTTNAKEEQIVYTKRSGGSQAYNNMPPYYALCYIMRL